MRMIIAKEQDKRIVDIFQSNSDILFTFFHVFRFKELSVQRKWLDKLKNGYFNWIIFTSFRSWKILINQILSRAGCIPDETRIVVFGPASVEQIKQIVAQVTLIDIFKSIVLFSTVLIDATKEKRGDHSSNAFLKRLITSGASHSTAPTCE